MRTFIYHPTIYRNPLQHLPHFVQSRRQRERRSFGFSDLNSECPSRSDFVSIRGATGLALASWGLHVLSFYIGLFDDREDHDHGDAPLTPIGYYLLLFALMGLILLVSVTSLSITPSSSTIALPTMTVLVILLGIVALAFIVRGRRR